MTGRSVFVTGAYGLLGSWLAKALLDQGAQVTVLKRDSVVRSALAIEGTEDRVNVVHGDLLDADLMDRAIAEYQVDLVFHLAAQTLVGVAHQSPVPTFETNIRGTWTLLEACRRGGNAQVVVAASDKAYGIHEELPYREDFALRPRYPYDVSKAATDLISRSYWHTFGLPVAVTRFANLYGGGDLNMSRLVPESVAAALQNRAPVIRSDGTLERDFIYVEDAVDAYLAIAGLLDAGEGAGEAYNAGSGRPHSVLDVVSTVCRVAGADVTPDIRGTGVPAGEIPLLALVAAAGLVAHGDLEDSLAPLDQASGDLRLDGEALLAQGEGAEQLGLDHLLAGHEVAQVDVEQQVRRQRHAAIAHDVEEGVAGEAIERPHAEGRVRRACEQRGEQVVQVRRLVLQVGVEDGGEAPPGVGQARAHGRSLSAVAVVLQQPHGIGPLTTVQELAGAVGGPVVDDHELEVHRELGGQDRLQRLLHRRRFVVDGDDDRQAGRAHDGGSTAASGRAERSRSDTTRSSPAGHSMATAGSSWAKPRSASGS
jgi:CDP-glucose 4,6-dehydratase